MLAKCLPPDVHADAEAYYIDATHLNQQKAIYINWQALGKDDFIKEQLQELLSPIHEELNNTAVPLVFMYLAWYVDADWL